MADLSGITNLVGPAGKPAVGTVERLAGLAKFIPVQAGDRTASYEGDTRIWWDDQATVFGPNGGEILIDEDGHEWEARYERPRAAPPITKKPPVRHTLTDNHGRSLTIEIEECGTFLNLRPEGYGNPVSLDFHDGRLRVLINADQAVEEPRVVDLERAEQ